MPKKFKANGEAIKNLRLQQDRSTLQKEFAAVVGMSVRKYRDIENANAEITEEEADRIARKLRVSRQEVLFAPGQPRLVQAVTPPPLPAYRDYPRFDDTYIKQCKDAGLLFQHALSSHIVVAHIKTDLNAETARYAEELTKILESLSFNVRGRFTEVLAGDEMTARRRLHELLVLLRGNDVWVYEEHHTKYLPERNDPQPGFGPDYEWQTIVVFGPPGEYGEDSIKIVVDNGQAWRSESKGPLF